MSEGGFFDIGARVTQLVEGGHAVSEGIHSAAKSGVGAATDAAAHAGPLAKLLPWVGLGVGSVELAHGLHTMSKPEAGSDDKAGPHKVTALDGVSDVVKGGLGIAGGLATLAGSAAAPVLGVGLGAYSLTELGLNLAFGDGTGQKKEDASDGGYKSNVKVRDQFSHKMLEDKWVKQIEAARHEASVARLRGTPEEVKAAEKKVAEAEKAPPKLNDADHKYIDTLTKMTNPFGFGL